MNTVTNIRITTAVKTNASLYKQVEDAFSVLSQLESIQNVQIIKRRKLTINQLFQRDATPLIVFESSGPKLYFTPDTPIYFHLDTVKVKLHMMKQHKMPVLIEMLDEITTDFKTFNFIDGTMGFGRDTYLILKHYQQAHVYAIEQNPLIHYVISEGMKRYLTEDELRRIHYINDDYHHWVEQHSEMVDILYLDHMFEQTLDEDDRMGELSRNIEIPSEIKSVSGFKYLIVKAHYKSELFKKFNTIQCIRKSTKTHYGLRINRGYKYE
ncbi:class I SAM-dependent methyltransferase [Mammaliicoccus sciuri]|uniref:class I SAM-dependent methyltransferase n=1 Tax=Mammaliicoccus sciuri TaxID=1296 RepID=UPI001E36C6C5|nr:class I SAM-dependent methyltransferase [Mammaliicoccus sciuri]MCD8894836.1 class I SAM-dependent methyltransferase [Mammaliicoccus sciuri]MCD8913025.1 class I SAM-dependent methyltransferase [Mammaliicoccus sciuri]